MPGYRPHRLSNGHLLPKCLTTRERQTYVPQFAKLRALMANGLTGVDLARCWVKWHILPLSRRSGLMHEYTGNSNDPQRFTEIEVTNDEVTESVKKMLDEPIAICSQTRLAPFYAANKLPAVSF